MWEWRFRIAGHPINKSPVLAIRRGAWKLLLNPDRDRVELYEIPADPMELSNRAEDHQDLVAAMGEEVVSWYEQLPPGHYDANAGSNAYPWPGTG